MAADAGFVEIKEAVALVGGEGVEGCHLGEVVGIGECEQKDKATGGRQEPKVILFWSIGRDSVNLVEITGGALGACRDAFLDGATDFLIQAD